MDIKPNNVIRVPTSLSTDFFRYWMEFLRPYHNLASRDMDVAACFLKLRYEASLKTTDLENMERQTLSTDNRKAVAEALDVNMQTVHIAIHHLKKKNVIFSNNRFNPRYIPRVEEGKPFMLMLIFGDKDGTVGSVQGSSRKA